MTDKDFARIDDRYLLVMFIPYYVDGSSRIWLERSWHRDFLRHTEYIKDLTLVAPELPYDPRIANLVPFADSGTTKVRFVALRPQNSTWNALVSLPHTIVTLWREIRHARIVHSGIVGWPFPLGWIANPIALLLKRQLVLVVESAPWRISTPGPHSVRKRITSWLTEKLGRYFMARADLAIATQPSYLESLRGTGLRGKGFVNPATWINEDEILPYDKAIASWTSKPIGPSACPKILFAGRLNAQKGIPVLLAAIIQIRLNGATAKLDIIGAGPLLDDCIRYQGTHDGLTVSVLTPVPYGPDFFRLLLDYHAVIIPSVSDEQPRIVFDAFAQAVPVIASNTDGIRPHVADGLTGWLVEPGSPEALIRAMLDGIRNPAEFEKRGLAALRVAESMTHREMHRNRSHQIAEMTASLNAPSH